MVAVVAVVAVVAAWMAAMVEAAEGEAMDQIYPDLPPYTELAPALGSGLGKAVYFLT